MKQKNHSMTSSKAIDVKQRPILFSTPMVQAILEGRKTMTRRVVKGVPDRMVDTPVMSKEKDHVKFGYSYNTNICLMSGDWIKCPYGKIGDVLWVRETFQLVDSFPEPDCFGLYLYKANGDTPPKCKSSLFMPKEAARIWLEITDIKVERLQDISEEDAVNEGIDLNNCSGDYEHTPVQEFETIWQKINGIESWNENPFVWVVSFKVLSTTGKP